MKTHRFKMPQKEFSPFWNKQLQAFIVPRSVLRHPIQGELIELYEVFDDNLSKVTGRCLKNLEIFHVQTENNTPGLLIGHTLVHFRPLKENTNDKT